MNWQLSTRCYVEVLSTFTRNLLHRLRANVEKRGSVSIDSSGTLVLHHVHTARVVVAAEVNKTGSTEAFVGLPAALFMCGTTFCTLNTID
jgi:hypothetical protein